MTRSHSDRGRPLRGRRALRSQLVRLPPGRSGADLVRLCRRLGEEIGRDCALRAEREGGDGTDQLSAKLERIIAELRLALLVAGYRTKAGGYPNRLFGCCFDALLDGAEAAIEQVEERVVGVE